MARKSKFSTDELKQILNQFVKEDKHKVMRLNFSNLEIYAKEDLELGGISYYHFSRNQEINELVKGYNKSFKTDSLSNLGDSNTFTSLNVKEFIRMYGDSKEKLTFYLSQIQEGQRKLYDRTMVSEMAKKAMDDKLKQEIMIKDEYKDKYKKLLREFNELKESYLNLAEALQIEEEKQFLSALKYTNVPLDKDYETGPKYDEDIKNLEKQKDLEKLLKDYNDIFD